MKFYRNDVYRERSHGELDLLTTTLHKHAHVTGMYGHGVQACIFVLAALAAEADHPCTLCGTAQEVHTALRRAVADVHNLNIQGV